jgi:hypothetical protein
MELSFTKIGKNEDGAGLRGKGQIRFLNVKFETSVLVKFPLL